MRGDAPGHRRHPGSPRPRGPARGTGPRISRQPHEPRDPRAESAPPAARESGRPARTRSRSPSPDADEGDCQREWGRRRLRRHRARRIPPGRRLAPASGRLSDRAGRAGDGPMGQRHGGAPPGASDRAPLVCRRAGHRSERASPRSGGAARRGARRARVGRSMPDLSRIGSSGERRVLSRPWIRGVGRARATRCSVLATRARGRDARGQRNRLARDRIYAMMRAAALRPKFSPNDRGARAARSEVAP